MDKSEPKQTAIENSPYRYWAFISHSSKDAKWARWLHNSIETYGIPAEYVSRLTPLGEPAPKRFHPTFHYKTDLGALPDLHEGIKSALRESRFLIVVCSPDAAQSEWVNKEILDFKALGREKYSLAVIVNGEPNTGGPQECFPPALQQGDNSPRPPDIRTDGKTDTKLMLLASMLGVKFDELKLRDRKRKRKRLLLTAIVSAMILGVIVGLSLVAIRKNNQATENKRLKQFGEYVNELRSLPRLWQLDSVELLRARLEHSATNAVAGDIRGFEWHYWDRMAHWAIATLDNESPVTSMDWSADGITLYFTDLSGRLLSWNVLSGKRTELRPTNSSARYVIAAPGGSHLAVISGSPLDMTPQTHTLEITSKLEIIDFSGAVSAVVHRTDAQFSCAAYSADGIKLVTGDANGQVEIWDANMLHPIISLSRNRFSRRNPLNPSQLLDQHSGLVADVSYNPDGSTVASVGIEGDLAIWNAENGKCLDFLNRVGHEGKISSVAFSRDGSKLVVRVMPVAIHMSDRAKPGEMLIWQKASLVRNKDQSETPIAIEFPTETPILRPVKQKSVVILGLEHINAEFTLQDSVLVTGVGNILRAEDSAGLGKVDLRQGHTSRITRLRVASAGAIVATSDAKGKIAIWNLRQAPCGNQELSLPAPARALAIAAGSNRRVVLRDAYVDGSSSGTETLSERKRITLYNAAVEIPIENSEGYYFGLAASKNGRYFATVDSLDGSALVWDFSTGKLIKKFAIPKDAKPTGTALGGMDREGRARAVAFRGDDELFVVGRTLAYTFSISSGNSDQIRGFPVGSAPQIRRLDGAAELSTAGDSAMCLAFSPDGQYAALGRADGDVSVVNAGAWQEFQRLRGHRRGVTALCFSKDSHRLISCSGQYVVAGIADPGREPGEVKVWDMNTWEECLNLALPSDHEYSGVALSDDDLKLTVSCNPVESNLNRIQNGKVFSWDTRAAEIAPLIGASAKNNGSFDNLTGKVLSFRSFAMSRGRVGFSSFAIHPSGDYLAAIDVGGALVVWNCHSGAIVGTASIANSAGWALKFYNKGSILLATREPTQNGDIFLTFPELTPIPRPPDQTNFNVDDFLRENQIRSSDNAWALEVADKAHSENIYVRNLTTGELSKEPYAFEPQLRQFTFFPDDKHFATIGGQCEVHIWSVSTPITNKIISQ